MYVNIRGFFELKIIYNDVCLFNVYTVYFLFFPFWFIFLLERDCGQEGLEYIFDQIYRHEYNGFLLKGVVQ